MKISTKGRYGLRAMIDLAMNTGGEYLSLASISERQDLSYNYLESIFSALKRANLVVGIAGSQGGYMLSCEPNEITVQRILLALEGDVSITGNAPMEAETDVRKFLKQNVWDIIDKRVVSLLEETTLRDLVNKYQDIVNKNQ